MGLFSGTANNVIGGPVEVFITDYSFAAPTRLSEIFNTSTYAANATYGWESIGLTEVPSETGMSADTEEWRSEQFGRFLTVPTDYEGEVTFTAMEYKQAKKLEYNALAIVGTEPVAGEKVTHYTTKTSFPQKRVALAHVDRFGRIHARVLPNVQWSGDDIRTELGRGRPFVQPITMKAYADTALLNATSGDAVLMYDIDQE